MSFKSWASGELHEFHHSSMSDNSIRQAFSGIWYAQYISLFTSSFIIGVGIDVIRVRIFTRMEVESMLHVFSVILNLRLSMHASQWLMSPQPQIKEHGEAFQGRGWPRCHDRRGVEAEPRPTNHDIIKPHKRMKYSLSNIIYKMLNSHFRGPTYKTFPKNLDESSWHRLIRCHYPSLVRAGPAVNIVPRSKQEDCILRKITLASCSIGINSIKSPLRPLNLYSRRWWIVSIANSISSNRYD